MPGPWEKYQNSQPSGPWQKYAPSTPSAPETTDMSNVPGALPGMQTPEQAAGIKTPKLHGSAIDYGKLLTAGDVAKGAAKGAGHTFLNISQGLNQLDHKLTPSILQPPRATGQPTYEQDQQHLADLQQRTTPNNTAQKIGYGGEQIGEFMVPSGIETAAVKGLTAIPKLAKAGPLIRPAVAALSSGLVNKAQGGDFSTGAVAGGAGGALGEGIKAMAPVAAETALRVRGNQRLFGRTVGDAIVNDTKGVRPETIAKTAQQTISRLSPELDAADMASAARGQRGSLTPARTGVTSTIASHQGNRAMGTAADIKPISDFLHTDALTGLPLSANQSAPGLRALKRGLNEDFIGKWSPDQPAAQKGAARAAYGDINSELHRISPGTADLDQRISSLIPVKAQGERVAAAAPLGQRVMSRFGAHTGALTLGAMGATAGYREGGAPGAIIGGVGGAVAPELIFSPEAQMIAARTMNKAGGLKPAVGGLMQAARNKRKDTEGTEQ